MGLDVRDVIDGILATVGITASFPIGILLALGYALAGVICFLLIVTIPFGVAAFRLANYSLWPFGRTLVSRPTAGLASGIANAIIALRAGKLSGRFEDFWQRRAARAPG